MKEHMNTETGINSLTNVRAVPVIKLFFAMPAFCLVLAAGLLVITPFATAATTPELPNASLFSTYSQGSIRGQLRPSYHTVISAGLSARLLSFPVLVGQQVVTGEKIAEFDCSVQKASVEVGIGRHEASQQRLLVSKRLEEYGNIGALELALAEAELIIAEAELERERSIMAECIVISPFSGTITDKFVQAHQYTNRGDQLFELIDTHNLEIEMIVPSILLRSHKPGANFTIHIEETGQVVEATINRTVGVVDPVSQTVKLIGEMLSEGEGLLPGMSGVVTFPDQLPAANR
jgi:membrane fusion protein (multidrug efflux system)